MPLSNLKTEQIGHAAAVAQVRVMESCDYEGEAAKVLKLDEALQVCTNLPTGMH